MPRPNSGHHTTRKREETQIQRLVFAHLNARAYPNVFAFHVANGGYRLKAEAAILKGMGVKAGVPDIIAIYRGRTYAMELKAPGGKTTEKQRAALVALEAAGAICAVAEGLERALQLLEGWGLLRRAAT